MSEPKPPPLPNDRGAERRRDARLPVSPPAHIRKLGGPEKVEVVNASYRGLFMRCPNGPPRLNELFKLRIQLPKTHIDVNAVAVRVVVDPQGRPGVGVRFFALGGEEKRAWESYIHAVLSPRAAA